jgi:crotonobetainyl-CoA:carnitine CoA-transferase CaiB-like acyl-CoA transferase
MPVVAEVEFTGPGDLPSAFRVTDFAAAAVAVAGSAVADVIALRDGASPHIVVDRRLTSMWFGLSIRPQSWNMPPPWDPVAGDYAAADGWIRLHTNAPHHRAVALAVLGAREDKASVAAAVAKWKADELETQIVEHGGAAAVMRSVAQWREHPQGAAVATEPLLHYATHDPGARPSWRLDAARPLDGVRVLDLTRILAGPVATRFLAGFGANVLRIDPPGWDEPSLAPEVTLGKRCAYVDLLSTDGIATFERLLSEADVLVHGYRPGALEALGLDAERRRTIRPELIDVSLDAYGWSGPWRARRGFDSLVQMSCGIADAGMQQFGKDKPFPLPVQALDQAAGYLMAAAVIRGLATRCETGAGCTARTSLARVAHALTELPQPESGEPHDPEQPSDQSETIEATIWGKARRLRAPLTIEGTPMYWNHPPSPLGSATATWEKELKA